MFLTEKQDLLIPHTSAVSCISGIINSETNDGVKNYYILTTKEGADVVDNTVSGKYESIIGIGNASIDFLQYRSGGRGVSPRFLFLPKDRTLTQFPFLIRECMRVLRVAGPTFQAGWR